MKWRILQTKACLQLRPASNKSLLRPEVEVNKEPGDYLGNIVSHLE